MACYPYAVEVRSPPPDRRRPARVAIAGFGTVGRSVARLLQDLAPPELQLAVIVNRDHRIASASTGSIRPCAGPTTSTMRSGDDVDVFVELIGGRDPRRKTGSGARSRQGSRS